MSRSFSSNADNSITGNIRTTPEDFQVDEIQAFEPTGQGEHVWLHLRKTGENSDWVAGQLARIAGVKRRDVGFAGLKDRHAVTTQWFSVWLPGRDAPDWQSGLPDSIELLGESRHDRKLRRGALKGNRFQILISDVEVNEQTEQRLLTTIESLRCHGMPNFYGRQRFGHQGRNVEMARQLFSGSLKVKNRQKRGLYLSAARSWLFNEVLKSRLDNKSWYHGLEGDVFMLAGSNSIFRDSMTPEIEARLNQQAIHPTGMLWGRGDLPTTDAALAIESRVAERNRELCEGLEKHGLKQERRALRCQVKDLDYTFKNDGVGSTNSARRKQEQNATLNLLELTFSLPPGAYATALLDCLGDFRDASARKAD